MRKMVLLLFIVFLVIPFAIYGCGDSNCNHTTYGSVTQPPTPIPMPTPTPTPTPGFNSRGDYLATSAPIGSYSEIYVDSTGIKGSADNLFVSPLAGKVTLASPPAPVAGDYYYYEISNVILTTTPYSSDLTFTPLLSELSNETKFGFFKPVDKNTFYCFDYPYQTSGYRNFYVYLPDSGAPVKTELPRNPADGNKTHNMISFFYQEDVAKVYTVCSQIDNIMIYRKNGTGATATHTLLLDMKMSVLYPGYERAIANPDPNKTTMIAGSILADADENIYYSYTTLKETAQGSGLYNATHKVDKLVPNQAKTSYSIDKSWTIESFNNLSAADYAFYKTNVCRISFGPENKIMVTSPVMSSVKVLDLADETIKPIPAPTTQNAMRIHYYSSSYNPDTNNLFLLATYGDYALSSPAYVPTNSLTMIYVYNYLPE